MNDLFASFVPGILVLTAFAAFLKKVDIFSAIRTGAREGLRVTVDLIPTLVALFTAIYMFRACGAMEVLTQWLRPAAEWAGIPPECMPLVLIRPLSGGGALAVAADLLHVHGPDSLIGRTASVMIGSTETTFYTIAVYFGAADIKKTRYTIPAALLADLTGFVAAALSVRLFF